MVRLFIIIVVVISSKSGYTQFSSLEELEKKCPHCSASDLTDSLIHKAQQFDLEKIDSSFYFLDKAEYVILNANGQANEKKPKLWKAFAKLNALLKQNEKVEFYLKRVLDYYLEKDSISYKINAYSGLAKHYLTIPDYASAYDSYRKGLKLSEESNDISYTVQMLVGIGNVYAYQAKFKEAIEVYEEIIEKQKQMEFSTDHLTVLNNIAACYGYLKDYDQSLNSLKEALDLSIENNDSASIALVYGNIGGIYVELDELEKAKVNLEKAIEINKILKRHSHLTGNYLNLALVLKSNNEAERAIDILEKVALASEKQGDNATLIEAYKELHRIYAENNQYKKAYEALFKFQELMLKIFNQKQSDKIANIKIQYEAEKRQKEIEILQKKEELSQEQIEKGRIITAASLVGVLLSFGLIISLVWSVRRKNKSNELIQSQNQELAKKNTEIIDSINYAKRLQNAILPQLAIFQKYLKESFIFFAPKDIVAGDFYFYDVIKKGNKKTVFYAAADCTGHGVPGAMVSIVGANGLKRCIQEFGLKEPGEILDRLASLVVDNFSQSEETIRDGMDIALCCIEYDKEIPKTLHYAGANNPLWIINPKRKNIPDGASSFRQGGGFEIKADKQAIGYTERIKPFTTHSVTLESGDTIYSFSDGFPDQFGGIKGKKYKSTNFKSFLLSIYDQDMKEQKRRIAQEFEEWKGKQEQIDDVCIIGVRL